MDRNLVCGSNRTIDIMSLSARRAWIEIVSDSLPALKLTVALRKESVDRNSGFCWWVEGDNLSLSARRAWIEISKIWYCGTSIGRRSPQGERG